jgi:hypothetical protein
MIESGNEEMLGQFRDAFGGEVPDLDRLAGILEEAPEASIQQATRTALGELPAGERGEIGGLVDAFLINSGIATAVPSESLAQIAQGDATVMGDVVGSLVKAQGLGALTGIFAGAPASEPTGLFGFITSLVGGDGDEFGMDDMLGLLKNPLALTLIGKLAPALMKLGTAAQ